MEFPGSIFHSRVAHVPTSDSGVTIGRGYDVKMLSKDKIVSDFTAAGIGKDLAYKYAQCIGLKGDQAKAKARELGLNKIEITHQ